MPTVSDINHEVLYRLFRETSKLVHSCQTMDKVFQRIVWKSTDALAAKDGNMLKLSSRPGVMEAPARLTRGLKPGTLFLPIHFGENPTNVLTNAEAVDPLAKIPEF